MRLKKSENDHHIHKDKSKKCKRNSLRYKL